MEIKNNKILCIALEQNPKILSGIATFERTLKKIFKKEIYFLAYKPKVSYFEVEDIIEIDDNKIIFKILKRIISRKRILRLIAKILSPKISIIQSPYPLIFLPKKSKKILVQHMCFEVEINNFFEKGNKEVIERAKQELDYFVFLSEYDRMRFINEIDWPQEKSVVIRHSCELELFKGNKVKGKTLIMICRLENKQKRIDLAILAMKELPDYILKIYGAGEDEEYLKEIVKINKIHNVKLMGAVTNIKEVLDEENIFIMTSDFEGYPISCIEAMRRGLPLIVRNTFDAARDIVVNNGVLLGKEWNSKKFKDAVEKIYDNYDEYSKNSIELGKRHEFDVIQGEWFKLIEKLKN